MYIVLENFVRVRQELTHAKRTQEDLWYVVWKMTDTTLSESSVVVKGVVFILVCILTYQDTWTGWHIGSKKNLYRNVIRIIYLLTFSSFRKKKNLLKRKIVCLYFSQDVLNI